MFGLVSRQASKLIAPGVVLTALIGDFSGFLLKLFTIQVHCFLLVGYKLFSPA